jgi:hypothetical protein
LTISSANPRLYFTDTDNPPDYFISNTDGTFTVYDVTNSTSRFTIGTTGNGTFGGNLTVGQIIRSGGTSSQFLKADGSVDSTAYLPLGGGTLTGNLNAQTIDLNNSTASNALRITHTNGSYHAVSIIATGNSALYASGSVTVIGTIQATSTIIAQAGLSNGAGQSFTLPSSTGTLALTSQLSAYLPLSGGTLTGALSGTSASFSNGLSINATQETWFSGYKVFQNNNTTLASYLNATMWLGFNYFTNSSGDDKYRNNGFATAYNQVNGQHIFYSAPSGTAGNTISFSPVLTLASTGAATFSSSVTATQVAIGTTSPATFLHVNGATAALPATSGTTQSAGNRVRLSTAAGTGILDMGCAGGTGMWLQSTDLTDLSLKYPLLLNPNGGNVGIGTTSPTGKLHIETSSGSSLLRLSAAAVNTKYYYTLTGGADDNFTISRDHPTGGVLDIMTWTYSGRVGIGTTSPTGKLDISHNSDNYVNIVTTNANNSSVLTMYNSTGTTDGAAIGYNVAMRFGTVTGLNASGFTERMRITSGGNVGIGTTAPIANANRNTLALQGAWGGQLDIMVGSAVHAQFGTDNFASGLSCRIQSADGIVFKPSSGEAMRITSAGSVFIGKTTGSSKFGVSGLPTSSAGLSSGDFYQVAGAVMVVP